MVHVAHSIPSVYFCVQWIASSQSEIENSSTSKWRKDWLKIYMQLYEGYIKNYKLQIYSCETELKQIESEDNGT